MEPLWEQKEILDLALQLPTIETVENHDAILYLAGLFDGEGSLGIYNHKRDKVWTQWAERMAIGMCEPEAVEVMKNVFGGRLYCYERYTKGHRDFYSWDVSNAGIEIPLRTLHPYLRVKREQAEVVLAFRICRRTRWIMSKRSNMGKNGITRYYEDWQKREMEDFSIHLKELKGRKDVKRVEEADDSNLLYLDFEQAV